MEKDPALYIILEGKVKLVSQRNRSLVVLKELKVEFFNNKKKIFIQER